MIFPRQLRCLTALDFGKLLQQPLWGPVAGVDIYSRATGLQIKVSGRFELALANTFVTLHAEVAVAAGALLFQVSGCLDENLVRPRCFCDEWSWVFAGLGLQCFVLTRRGRTRQHVGFFWCRFRGGGGGGDLIESAECQTTGSQLSHTFGSRVSFVERCGNASSSLMLRHPDGMSAASA